LPGAGDRGGEARPHRHVRRRWVVPQHSEPDGCDLSSSCHPDSSLDKPGRPGTWCAEAWRGVCSCYRYGQHRSTQTTRPLSPCRTVYDRVLGHRKDSMFELMEAVLVADGPATIVRLSLEAVFRRLWSSAPDALSDGRLDVGALQQLIHAELIHAELAQDAAADRRPIWALDGTVWPPPCRLDQPRAHLGPQGSSRQAPGGGGAWLGVPVAGRHTA